MNASFDSVAEPIVSHETIGTSPLSLIDSSQFPVLGSQVPRSEVGNVEMPNLIVNFDYLPIGDNQSLQLDSLLPEQSTVTEAIALEVENSDAVRNDLSILPSEQDPLTGLSKDDDEPSNRFWKADTPGVFTVDDSGIVSIDFLFDGGKYQSELAFFSLMDMDDYVRNPIAFRKEAVRRALSESSEGNVVILDREEGSKFAGTLGTYERTNWNSGEYRGVKSFEMNPGSQFGWILSSKRELENMTTDSDYLSKELIFSLPDLSYGYGSQLAGITAKEETSLDIVGGSVYGFEDIPLSDSSDMDYNDLIFSVQGASSSLPSLNVDMNWQNSKLGESLIEYFDLSGKGLTARYYDDVSFTEYRGRRNEGSVDYDWGLGAPDVVTQPDSFSIRWTGQVRPLYTEEYTLSVRSDDQIRLWIDDTLLIDQWLERPLSEDSEKISLEAGKKYNIRLEYADVKGESSIEFSWSSDTQHKEIIPQNLLYPDPEALPMDLETGMEYHPGELLVKFDKVLDEEEVIQFSSKYGAKNAESLVKNLPTSVSVLEPWWAISFEEDKNLNRLLEKIRKDSRVVAAGFDYFLEPTRSLPTDPDFPQLWGLDNSLDHDIDAPEAWDINKGTKDVVVAVVDSGIDYNHPDLQDNIWKNRQEVPLNGIDDDKNGYVDDYLGYDVANNDADPMDVSSHGTHVAGTIGAVGSFSSATSQGIIGVSPNVSLMAIKAKDTEGLIRGNRLRHATEGIYYAVSNGADIINASWGFERNFWTDNVAGFFKKVFKAGTSFSAATDAVKAANDAGILFVASAGNDGSDIDSSGRWPSSLGLPNVITVASTTRNDDLAKSSNYGVNTVDIAAPGEGILSTIPGGIYGYKSGTSMAAPHVSGAAALLLSQEPFLTASELRQILMRESDPIPALSGKTAISGRLNVYNALLSLNPKRRVKLTINELYDVGILDPKPPIFNRDRRFGDFYATGNINDIPFGPTQNTSDDRNPKPNWEFIEDVTGNMIDISLTIHDKDGGPFRPFNGDDTADINPSPDSYTLNLSYDVEKGEVINRETQTVHRPEAGGRFFFSGDNNGDKVDVRFTLEASWV